MPMFLNASCTINDDLTLQDLITVDGTLTGAPVNITGWSLKCVIHAEVGDGTPLKTYSTGAGQITIPVGSDGNCYTQISNADIQALGVGDWPFYVQRTAPGNNAVLTLGVLSIIAV